MSARPVIMSTRSVIVRRLQYEGSRILNRTVSLLVLPFFEKRANVLKKLFYAYVRKVRTCPNGPLCPQDPLLCPQGPLLSGVRLLQTNVVGWSGTNLHHRIAGFDDIILQTNVVGWSGTNLHLQTNVVGW